MNRPITILVLLLPLLALGLWTASLFYTRATSPIYTVKIEGYDPRDLIHGRHIIFRYVWDTATPLIDPTPDVTTGRYYIPESDADTLDALFRQNAHDFAVRVQMQNGEPHIRDLLINNTPWKVWLSDNAPQPN